MYSLNKILRTISLIALTLGCFALSPQARAVCQEGCLFNNSTVLGDNALFNHTSGGNNTAVGWQALFSTTTSFFNTAIGANALYHNTGANNTAIGDSALVSNTAGGSNTASGVSALLLNTTGYDNTANGADAMTHNTTGISNTAIGNRALFSSEGGDNNTAIGLSALFNNQTGDNNTALGFLAGELITGSNNIDIGNAGVAGESAIIRIGTAGTQTATFIAGIRETPVAQGVAVGVGITADGQLGVRASSERFKEAIKPMDKTSEAIFSLKPVSFRYKKALDPKGLPQFGLVAEQVAKVDPDLVACDAEGKPFTVRYDEVNAMLLNEFLKAHQKAEQQETMISELKSALVRQQQDMAALASQLQKVSDRLELAGKAARIVATTP